MDKDALGATLVSQGKRMFDAMGRSFCFVLFCIHQSQDLEAGSVGTCTSEQNSTDNRAQKHPKGELWPIIATQQHTQNA